MNPLEIRPNVACIIVQPKTPDEIKTLMAQLASELAGLDWWVRTGASAEELQIVKAAGKKGAACFFRKGKLPEGIRVLNINDLDSEIIDKANQLFKNICDTKLGGSNNIDPKHWPRGVEQLLALAGSSLDYSTCSRLLITWWPEKKHALGENEKWPLSVETVFYGRTSPEFSFSSNIVNLARNKWRQSFDVEIPKLRTKMPTFTEEEIASMDPQDASWLPF